MKRWALVVLGLYFLILVIMAVPWVMVTFAPDLKPKDAADLYINWGYWLMVGVMLLSQAALLAVPVHIANRRPVTRRSLLMPVLAGGFMMGCLGIGAIYCLFEAGFRDKGPDWMWWAGIGAGVLLWVVWGIVFFRLSRRVEPVDFVSRQCRTLLKGSILELLIAVPTHLVARNRDYCCAGFMTFIGLTLGMSVMLFSFGPAVFFLYVHRWRQLHPEAVQA